MLRVEIVLIIDGANSVTLAHTRCSRQDKQWDCDFIASNFIIWADGGLIVLRDHQIYMAIQAIGISKGITENPR